MAATQSAETALLPSRILAMQEMVPKRTAVGQPSRAATAPEFAPTPPGVEPALSELEFPGCYARPMTVAEYDEYEGRIEFFDSRAGIAWLAREAAHFPHERPLNMFGPLLREIGMTRGSQIVCGGMVEIRRTFPDGRTRRIQPDQMVYLDPATLDRTGPQYLTAREDPTPDVVVEVDSTTDARRCRLKLYEAWGFPELWVEVPNAYAPNRPAGLRPGLTIYLLEAGRYVPSPSSRAFPGWRADEIHRALNEPVISKETSKVLSRVGRAMGEREGTGARRTTHCSGNNAPKGAPRGARNLPGRCSRGRGIAVSPDFPSPDCRAALAAKSAAAIAAAASTASSEPEFLARLAGDPPSAGV